MDKKTRNIIIGITSAILIILIIVIVCIVIGNSNKKNKIENEPELENIINESEDPEQNSNIEENIEDDVQNEEETEQEIKNEVSSNSQNNQQTQQKNQTSQNQIIGREEQESIPEEEGPTDEEKVIELVKKQWGSKDSTVSYNIANHDGNIYMVSVNSKETTEVKAWYQVNLATGETTQL